ADAREAVEEALELARRHGERGNEAEALRVLGECAASGAQPDLATARRSFEQALTLAADLEMRPLIAHCHLGLGKLYRRTGNREQAREHLTTATTMYREMDMRFYLEQAEAALHNLACSGRGLTMAGQDNLHIARESFAAWNAHDVEAFVKRLDTKTIWESDTFPAPFVGHQGARHSSSSTSRRFPICTSMWRRSCPQV